MLARAAALAVVVAAGSGLAAPAAHAGPYVDAVKAAVSPARLASPVPKRLNPLPSRLWTARPHGCVTWGGLGRRCTLGDVHASRRMVLFGDSHAGSWLRAFSYYASTRGYALTPMVHAGCTTGTAPFPTGCRGWYLSALARMRALGTRIVVIAQYVDPREPASATYHGIYREVGGMRRVVPHVIVLQDAPRHLQLEPRRCLQQPGATLGDCTFRVDAVERAEYPAVARLVKGRGGIWFRTAQWFCYRGVCPTVVRRTITFVDTNHPTTTYVRVLAPAVAATLDGMVGSRPH